jgi:DNA-binding NarL/FixJ family response regulator
VLHETATLEQSLSAPAPAVLPPGSAATATRPRPPRRPRGAASPASTLALVGGRRLLREATARVLGAQRGLDVHGTYDSVTSFLADERAAPAIVVVDVAGLSHAAGCEVLAALLGRRRELRVVALCHRLTEEAVACAIRLGVDGLILESYSAAEVRATIGSVAEGHTVLPAGWQRALSETPPASGRLSPRHEQILELIAQGRGNEEIAMHLDLSLNTVKFHVRTLYARLGVRNRVQAANLYGRIADGRA